MHLNLYPWLLKTLQAKLFPRVSVLLKKQTNILGLNIFIQEAACTAECDWTLTNIKKQLN